jgi:hypothetical protein
MPIPDVIEHRDAPEGEIHTPTNWTFENMAQAEAATGITSADLGKWAYLKDDQVAARLIGFDIFGNPSWETVGVADIEMNVEANARIASDANLQAQIDGLQIGGGDKTYHHTQGSPSTTWVVDHHLNKYPSVTVRDSAGTVMLGGISYPTVNQAVITFATAFSGTVDCN